MYMCMYIFICVCMHVFYTLDYKTYTNTDVSEISKILITLNSL